MPKLNSVSSKSDIPVWAGSWAVAWVDVSLYAHHAAVRVSVYKYKAMKNILPVTVLLVAACTGGEQITDCEPRGDIAVYCDMGTPEDIAALPDGRHLLLAHFGQMGDAVGTLSLFDTATGSRTHLFPEGEAEIGTPDWGVTECTTPPGQDFSPHGTHLQQLEDGRWRYLVVNHGNREAVELFEVWEELGNYNLVWRGCVPAGLDTLMNDVVGLTNGDLIYSRMLGESATWSMFQSILGMTTGELWRWRQGGGLEPLPATAAAQPNGLEISADNRHVFADMYMENEVWKVDVDSGQIVGRAPISAADNSAWGADGRLYVATHTGGFLETIMCFSNQSQTCGGAFEIIALDPESMSTEKVFSHSGPPMGVATVAVPQGGRVWMGSYAGDRMISVPDFTTGE